MELPGAANQEVDSTHTHTPHTERFSDFLTSLMLDVDVLEKTSCGMMWLFASWITHTHTELPGRLETWRKVSGPPICPFLVFYHPLSSF